MATTGSTPTISQYRLMEKATTSLVLGKGGQNYWGSMALNLGMVEDPNIPTACTDGIKMWFNPDYVSKLTHRQKIRLVCHEVLHVGLEHIFRIHPSWDMEIANLAGDMEANVILRTHAIGDEIDGAVYPEAFGLPMDWCFEQYYRALCQMGKKDGSGKPKGQPGGGYGGFKKAPDPNKKDPTTGKTPREMGLDKDGWTAKKVQALKAVKSIMGKLPADLERMLGEYTTTTIGFKSLLMDFLENIGLSYWDWMKPDPQYAESDIFMPSLNRDVEMPPFVVVVDSSGSITTKVFDFFISAVGEALSAYPTTMHLIVCDADVQSVTELSTGELDQLKQVELKGGGGTDFRPPFEWIEKNGVDPVCVIYLTDMEGTFPDRDPGYPVLWCATEDHTAPFGSTIRVEVS